MNHAIFIIALFLFFSITYINFKFNNEGFNNEGFTNEIIPHVVYQTWETSDLPPLMKKNRDKMMHDNPEFKYVLMDKDQRRQFIKENFDEKTLKAYDKLIPGAYKADLWRYCVIYKNGGIYLDIKLRNSDNFKLITLTDKEHYIKDRDEFFVNGDIGIYNACLILKKGNEVMKKCIEQCVKNVENKYYGPNALYPTGPGLVGKIYSEMYSDHSNMDLVYIGDENITLNGNIIIQTYKEFNQEVPSRGSYGKLWLERRIYN